MPAPLVVQKYGGSSRRRRRPHQARRAADRPRARGRARPGRRRLGDGRHHGRAARPRGRDHRRARTRASSTSCSRPASTRARPSSRWRSTRIGVAAISLTGPQAGITTDGTYGRARIAGIEPRRVRAELEGGKVVIVAGFQGQSAAAEERQEITTLGRGGSDTTAVALAAALKADRCQIFTDVRGIFTADPRLVPDARQLPVIGYEEMLELAHQGAQVMQVRAVELGWVNGVVIEVLSSFEDAPGTLIKEDPLVEQRNKVRGLAHDRNVAKVTIVAVPDRPGIARAIFEPLAEAGVNVDMIVQNVGHGGETDLSFTVPQVELGKAKKASSRSSASSARASSRPMPRSAKVSIVGAGLHNAPGYAARMFGTLADAGVNIEMISTSEVRITCMIAEDELETALRALHDAFELERPETDRGRSGRAEAPRIVTAVPRPPERFAVVGSTNDVVRGWLADGDAGGLRRGRRRADRRSRSRRTDLAGAAGRRAAGVARRSGPTWLAPERVWRLAATASLAMAEAAEVVAGLPDGAIRLKWPNDLVIEASGRRRRVCRSAPGRWGSARWPGSSARPTASARPTPAPSSASGSTPTGPRPISRPTSRAR